MRLEEPAPLVDVHRLMRADPRTVLGAVETDVETDAVVMDAHRLMLAHPPAWQRGAMVGRSGDGFIRCSDGHVRWGLFGAPGVVFVHVADACGPPEVLLQLRSTLSHEGGTWSCPGGAIDAGETPLVAALREAAEEIGPVPEVHRIVGEYVFAPAVEWTYTTAVVEVPARFGTVLNFETAAVEWVPVDDVAARPLHAGFRAAWPHIYAIVTTTAG